MGKLSDWFEYLNSACYAEGSVYIRGGQGEIVTDKDIIKRVTNAGDQKKCLKHYNEEVKKGRIPVHAFDCSGLGMQYLYNMTKIISSDKTAQGMRALCTKVDRAALLPGDWCFVVENGRATHIGYAVSKDYAIECRNYETGVYCSKIDERSWNEFGRPNFWIKQIESDAELTKCIDYLTYVKNFLTNERGML